MNRPPLPRTPQQRINDAIEDIVAERVERACQSMINIVTDHFVEWKAGKAGPPPAQMRRLLREMEKRKERWQER